MTEKMLQQMPSHPSEDEWDEMTLEAKITYLNEVQEISIKIYTETLSKTRESLSMIGLTMYCLGIIDVAKDLNDVAKNLKNINTRLETRMTMMGIEETERLRKEDALAKGIN